MSLRRDNLVVVQWAAPCARLTVVACASSTELRGVLGICYVSKSKKAKSVKRKSVQSAKVPPGQEAH